MPRARKTSRRAIAQCGMRIARRQGIDAVTVRAVAAALDVTPMALYHHVGSVDGLREAVVDQILLDARVGMAAGGNAVARVSTFAREARAALGRYPGAAAVLLAAWPRLEQGSRIMELLLATTESITTADAHAALARRLFELVVASVIVDEAATAVHRSRSSTAAYAHPERFPRLVAAREAFERRDADQEFEAGLAMLVATAGSGVTSG